MIPAASRDSDAVVVSTKGMRRRPAASGYRNGNGKLERRGGDADPGSLKVDGRLPENGDERSGPEQGAGVFRVTDDTKAQDVSGVHEIRRDWKCYCECLSGFSGACSDFSQPNAVPFDGKRVPGLLKEGGVKPEEQPEARIFHKLVWRDSDLEGSVGRIGAHVEVFFHLEVPEGESFLESSC